MVKLVLILFGMASTVRDIDHNHLGVAFLLTVYVVYGCAFESLSSADSSDAFMVSWLWSVVQRFLAMEPILPGALLPTFFAMRRPACPNPSVRPAPTHPRP